MGEVVKGRSMEEKNRKEKKTAKEQPLPGLLWSSIWKERPQHVIQHKCRRPIKDILLTQNLAFTKTNESEEGKKKKASVEGKEDPHTYTQSLTGDLYEKDRTT